MSQCKLERLLLCLHQLALWHAVPWIHSDGPQGQRLGILVVYFPPYSELFGTPPTTQNSEFRTGGMCDQTVLLHCVSTGRVIEKWGIMVLTSHRFFLKIHILPLTNSIQSLNFCIQLHHSQKDRTSTLERLLLCIISYNNIHYMFLLSMISFELI